LEIIVVFETELIEERASHLKPKVIILYKSFKFFILLVEYFSTTNSKSFFSIHSQSSLIIILSIHQFIISIITFSAQASILFSINSFITDTGLSTTSQAAI
jgi:hypothetical protein